MNVRNEKVFTFKRNEIINAAKRLFLKHDFDTVTMKEIAKEAEFNRNTVYNYFSNKYLIIEEIFFELVQKKEKIYDKIINLNCSGIEKVKYLAEEYYNEFHDKPIYNKLNVYFSYSQNSQDNDKLEAIGCINERHEELRKKALKLVESGIQDGSIRVDIQAINFIRFFTATLHNIMCYRSKDQIKDYYFQHTDIVILGIKRENYKE